MHVIKLFSMLTLDTEVKTTIKNVIVTAIFIGSVLFTVRRIFTVVDDIDQIKARIEVINNDITDIKVATAKMQESINYLKEAGSK